MKCLDNFANIGKSVIIQSLGIQKNYTEVIEATVETIDYNNAACINCKYKAVIETFGKDSRAYSDACSTCEHCPHKALSEILMPANLQLMLDAMSAQYGIT